MTRRPAIVVALAVTCAACSADQDPEPLTKTVPTAVVVATVCLAAASIPTRRLLRRLRDRAAGAPSTAVGDPAVHPLRAPRTTVALTVAPTAAVVVSIAIGLGRHIAIGYREPTTAIFSWNETVGWTVVLGIVAAAVHALACRAAVDVTSTSVHDRRRGRTTLLLAVVVGFVLGGIGLVWVPALAATYVTGPTDPDRQLSPG